MIRKKVEIVTRRSFSEEFKKQCVLDFESGRFTVLELSKLYDISFALLYRCVSTPKNSTV